MVEGLYRPDCELCPGNQRRIAQVFLADLGRIERLDCARAHFYCADRRFYRGGGCIVRHAHTLDNLKFSIMRSQWFVIHTLSGQEQKVKESIEKRIKTEEMSDFIKEVLVPMEKVVEVRNQKKTVSTR